MLGHDLLYDIMQWPTQHIYIDDGLNIRSSMLGVHGPIA
jgi:hypothetical protein